MPSVGEYIQQHFKETSPGIKGTPEYGKNVASLIAGLEKGAKSLVQGEDDRFPWLKTPVTAGMAIGTHNPLVAGASMVGSLLGKFILGKDNKMVKYLTGIGYEKEQAIEKAKSAKGKGLGLESLASSEFNKKCNMIILDLQTRGEDNETIQTIIDKLAGYYGVNTRDISDF